MKNEIDEGFKGIIDQIIETLQELVFGMIQEENPSKTKENLIRMFEEKIGGNLSLKMTKDIVNLMYTETNPKKQEILREIED